MCELLEVAEEVRDALAEGRGVVALETSVIGQGLPSPANEECVRRMGAAIRAVGAVPAWTGVADARVVVGLGDDLLARFCGPGAPKVARRDLPVAAARRTLGATTVSATVWAAAAAGVHVAATGGIGGVHPGDGTDVSADLFALANTPGLLVCSGPKSIIDPGGTAARLEELGVAIVGYGVDRLPFFLAVEAPVDLEHRADGAAEAASILRASLALGVTSSVLVCNPIPAGSAMDADEIALAVREAERRADRAHAVGKSRTPFLLASLAELTGGRSLAANLALLEDNARVAAEIAVAYEVERLDPERS